MKVNFFFLIIITYICMLYDEEYDEDILKNGATLNIFQYVSRLEGKDDTPKKSFEELYAE